MHLGGNRAFDGLRFWLSQGLAGYVRACDTGHGPGAMREWSIIVILFHEMRRNCVRSSCPGISVFQFRALLDAWEESLAGSFTSFPLTWLVGQ
jgi:hypothetical protein